MRLALALAAFACAAIAHAQTITHGPSIVTADPLALPADPVPAPLPEPLPAPAPVYHPVAPVQAIAPAPRSSSDYAAPVRGNAELLAAIDRLTLAVERLESQQSGQNACGVIPATTTTPAPPCNCQPAQPALAVQMEQVYPRQALSVPRPEPHWRVTPQFHQSAPVIDADHDIRDYRPRVISIEGQPTLVFEEEHRNPLTRLLPFFDKR